eukprot:scaffold12667_cov50-Phaeocystis_antarctica.AAC.5
MEVVKLLEKAIVAQVGRAAPPPPHSASRRSSPTFHTYAIYALPASDKQTPRHAHAHDIYIHI